MRVLRGVLGVLLAVLGLVLAVVGAAAAFWLIGPDDTVYSGEQHLAVQGRSLVTTPNLVDQHGPTLHVRARSLDGKPVFVGVGRNFDVASYVETDAYTSLVQIKYPIAFSTEEHTGSTTPLAAPATLDWWVAKTAGPGQQSLTWPIQDGPYQVVVMPAAGNAPVDVQLEFGIEIPFAFLASFAVLVIGLALIALAWLTFRRRPRRTAADAVAQESATDKTPATLRTALSVAAVLTLTAGCGGLPVDNTVTTLSRPAVTADTGRAVLTRYDEVVVKAARTRDLKAASTVEADDQVERTQASYQLAGLRKAAVKPPAPFAQATVAAPDYSSYPMRFAALTSGRQLGLWVRQSAGTPWRRTFTATAAATLPPLTGAREIASDHTGPIATSFANFLSAGGNSPDRKLFTLGPEVTALLADRAAQAKQNKALVASSTDRFTISSYPATLLTPAGESLAFFTVTEKLFIATDGSRPISWIDGDEAVLSSATYDSGLTATYSHTVVLVVPAKGTARVVAFGSQVLKAGGY
ncbi:hypothetical protein ACIA49_23160 [Kribbella sp. NPDC051587]|uniref:hypothetical protein n=1 Tax=Kribbella sp. NPDC051587 TaxID=3364119 RepID=UPI0037A8AF7D